MWYMKHEDYPNYITKNCYDIPGSELEIRHELNSVYIKLNAGWKLTESSSQFKVDLEHKLRIIEDKKAMIELVEIINET